jgi:hypothetical protein
MRKGRAWSAPPTNVAPPVTRPRAIGPPRPEIVPSSERASDIPMLMAAPSAAANPTSRAVRVPATKAAAKIGASVETVPSIRPIRPGWTT